MISLFGAAAQAQTVQFPPYDADPYAASQGTRADYEAAVADDRFSMRRISYPSDGLEVFAYVYGPVSTDEVRPVVIFSRGTTGRPTFHSQLLVIAHRFADAGFIVVAPQYRGNGGNTARDEVGGADLNDLFALVPVLKAMPGADASRLFLYGESRGGMMVYQALRDGFPARAAAVYGALTELEWMLENPQWAAAGALLAGRTRH